MEKKCADNIKLYGFFAKNISVKNAKNGYIFCKKILHRIFFPQGSRLSFFLFFRFFSWFSFKNIWRSIKFLNPKLCLHTKYGHTQSTKKSPKTLYLSFQEEETQENQCSNPVQTATLSMCAVRKNSKTIIGRFTHFGNTVSSIRTFAVRSLKCYASATSKH